MICAKTPYRISTSGGSCDYTSFFSKYGCLITSFALDLHCYVSIKPLPKTASTIFEIFYSTVERVKKVSEIQNATIRGTLEYFLINHPELSGLSIYVANSASHQSGLATSSALVCSLLTCLYCYSNEKVSKEQIAKEAIYIERILLNQSGGIQDSIACAYGGLNSITIEKDGNFKVRPLPVSESFVEEFTSSSILFFINGERQSYEIAASHDTVDSEKFKLNILQLSNEMKSAFEKENIKDIGNLLHRSWQNKKQISGLISNSEIDNYYDIALKNGAFGGKLLGTGGGGFLYIVCEPTDRNRIIEAVGLPHLDVGIDNLGSRVIFRE